MDFSPPLFFVPKMDNSFLKTPPASSPQYVKGTPDWVKPHIDRAALAFNIPTMVLSSLLKQESGFNPNAVSPVGARGIAQFMPGTAKSMGVDPHDPAQSIMGAARYLRNSLNQFGNKMDLALASYNAGPGAVSMYGNTVPPYKETQNYVKNIMSMAGEPHSTANQPTMDVLAEARKQAQSGDSGSISMGGFNASQSMGGQPQITNPAYPKAPAPEPQQMASAPSISSFTIPNPNQSAPASQPTQPTSIPRPPEIGSPLNMGGNQS